MNKFVRIILISFFAVFLLVGTTMAAPFNNRQVPVHTDGTDDLQHVFNSIGLSNYDVDTDQQTAAIFTNQSSAGSISSFIFTDLDYLDSGDSFGIYSFSDSSKMLEIFDGDAAPGDQQAVSFKADGSVEILNTPGTTIASFGNQFGFYLQFETPIIPTGFSSIFYTEDDKNFDSEAWALTFQGDGTTRVSLPDLAAGTFATNEWIIAFDGDPHTGSAPYTNWKDFNDFVVMVESIEPVPEPATMLLLGSGLLGLAGVGRKKFFKKKG